MGYTAGKNSISTMLQHGMPDKHVNHGKTPTVPRRNNKPSSMKEVSSLCVKKGKKAGLLCGALLLSSAANTAGAAHRS